MSCCSYSPVLTTPKTHLKPGENPFLVGDSLFPRSITSLSTSRRAASAAKISIKAALSPSKEAVMRDFHERKALKIISGLHNFNWKNVASVVTAADKVCIITISSV